MNEKYLAAVETIKAAILKSQSRTVENTNRESLLLYYSIGGYVSGNSREGTWGTGVIDEISARLREELPGLRGFSSRNIKSMRQFYEAWQPYLQLSQPLELSEKSAAAATDLVLTAEAVLTHSEIDRQWRPISEWRILQVSASRTTWKFCIR